jgi:hypothetical protein
MFILNYEQQPELEEFLIHEPLGARCNRVASYNA